MRLFRLSIKSTDLLYQAIYSSTLQGRGELLKSPFPIKKLTDE